MKRSSVIVIIILIFGFLLRFYAIDSIPPGLYIDEVSIGNNAYSLLTTGRDEHGEQLPVFFEAFGEYKMPVYIYFTTASFYLFGKSELALRLPSVFLGSLTILVFYFFVKELFSHRGKKQKQNITSPHVLTIVATFLFAISPWHIHFSRGGFEATVALFFYLLGVFAMILFSRSKKVFLIFIACISFVFALYSYSIYKFIAPITFLFFCGIYFFYNPQLRRKLVVSVIVFTLLFFPMIQFSFTQEGNSRFNQTSAFAEYPTKNALEQVIIYPMVILKDYLSYFSLDFLFVNGDGNGRHQAPGMGLFFRWELPFLLLGIFWLFQQKNRVLTYILLGLLLIAPLIPSVARPSPHSLRSLLLVIPITILIACGIIYAYQLLPKFKKAFIVALSFVIIVSFALYLHRYYFHYPIVNALDWGAAHKQTVEKTVYLHRQFKHVVIDSKLAFAQVYFKFYAPTLPVQVIDLPWKKPTDWKGDVLYIYPYHKDNDPTGVIDQVYLKGPNKDIYSQFKKL